MQQLTLSQNTKFSYTRRKLYEQSLGHTWNIHPPILGLYALSFSLLRSMLPAVTHTSLNSKACCTSFCNISCFCGAAPPSKSLLPFSVHFIPMLKVSARQLWPYFTCQRTFSVAAMHAVCIRAFRLNSIDATQRDHSSTDCFLMQLHQTQLDNRRTQPRVLTHHWERCMCGETTQQDILAGVLPYISARRESVQLSRFPFTTLMLTSWWAAAYPAGLGYPLSSNGAPLIRYG